MLQSNRARPRNVRECRQGKTTAPGLGAGVGAEIGRVAMRWFRSHIGLGARLALFALAVQLALSFAHVHVADSGRTQAAAVGGAGNAPTPKSDGPVDPGCAICGLIQLAASATPSAAPALPLLVASGHARLAAANQLLLVASPRLLFQARAPPAA
jgi:hypothetical protein